MEVAAENPAARTAASSAGCISGKPADKEGEQERRLYGDGEGGQAGRQGGRQAISDSDDGPCSSKATGSPDASLLNRCCGRAGIVATSSALPAREPCKTRRTFKNKAVDHTNIQSNTRLPMVADLLNWIRICSGGWLAISS